MNGACFDSYDRDSIYDLCRLRIDNNAAVVRFKFSTQEAYEAAYADLIVDGGIRRLPDIICLCMGFLRFPTITEFWII